ncbi:MAG: hypothetical protein JSW40_05180, partial [Candidatus Omnitrophota bacterium]
MKSNFGILVAGSVVLSLVLVGCSQKKAESSKAAIETSKSMESTEKRISYLLGQANALYNSKEFQGAVE